MSAALGSFLGDLLEASSCTTVVFVQDNCPSLKTPGLDDMPSCSSSISEISRWDSSSSGMCCSGTASTISTTGGDCGDAPKCEIKRKVLQPPRRQVSFDDDVNMSDESSCLDMSASLDRPSEATETSTSSPVSRSNSNISVLPSYESPSANRPPRPPTRRTSSRLKSVMLSALQTNLDRLHPQEAPVSSLWRSLSSLNTSVSSLTDTDQYVQRISASASSSPVSAGSRQTLRSDVMDLKNGIMSSTADITSGVKTQPSPVLAPPPRKPQRQGTPENMEKKTLGLPSSLANTTAKSSENNGDSLRDLIRLRRMSTTRQARPNNGTCLES